MQQMNKLGQIPQGILPILKVLKLYVYEWKDDGSKDAGPMAQELFRLFGEKIPGIVKYKNDRTTVPKSLEEINARGPVEGALVVEHNALNSIALAGLQEMAGNVEYYEKELNALNEKVEANAHKIEEVELKIESADTKIEALTDRVRAVEISPKPYRSAATMEKHFKSKLKNYNSFYGREWLFKTLRERAVPTDHRGNEWFVLLQAPAGFGKTAVMAKLAGHYEGDSSSTVAQTIQENVIAHHFCNANNGKTLRGKAFLLGLADCLKKYSATFCNYYSPDSEDTNDLRVAVVDALGQLSIPGTQKFILVDGLDECLDNNDVQPSQSVLTQLKKLRTKLPAWLTIIATARKDDRVNKQLRSLNANFVIDKNMTGWDKNINDVNAWARDHFSRPLEGQQMPLLLQLFCQNQIKRHVLSFLPQPCSIMERPISKNFLYVQDVGFRMFCKAADGNYQYAVCTLKSPDSVNSRPIFITDLKPGLEEVYKLRYDSIFEDCMGKFDEFVKPLLELLLAANGPLSDTFLDVEGRERKRYRGLVKQICRVQDGAWEISHKSYKDWFTKEPKDKNDYFVDVNNGHKKLAWLGHQ
eukprot:g869.t1